MAQADGQFRDSVEDIANLRTRNDQAKWCRLAVW